MSQTVSVQEVYEADFGTITNAVAVFVIKNFPQFNEFAVAFG